MKILLLGYGKEGKSAEQFFRAKEAEIEVLEDFSRAELEGVDYGKYDLVLRSPSVQPWLAERPERLPAPNWTSATKYFFEHCPCPIIGVTGTKGKGTTCTMIRDLLTALGQKVWLVGNIGTPALDKLEEISSDDIVIYEMSSFQLWDMPKSPHIAVVLRIEPDHLNIHHSFEDYVNAKSNITKWQEKQDYCTFYQNNQFSRQIAEHSAGKKLPYPVKEQSKALQAALDALSVRGQHNRENAEAALLAVAAARNESLDELLEHNLDTIQNTLQNYKGLPHRLQFLRKLNGVEYYNDNFSTTVPSTEVALAAFRDDEPVILIVGGRDKTEGEGLSKLAKMLESQPNIAKIVLIGESGRELNHILDKKEKYMAENLPTAVAEAQKTAEKLAAKSSKTVSVLMSPAAASFDMFENVYDRGAKFQEIVRKLG